MRQSRSTTEVFGSSPMRQVPAWCWPPLSPCPGTRRQVLTAPASFSHASALPARKCAISSVCGCLPSGEARHGNAPAILTFGIHLHAGIVERHLLHGTHHRDGALVSTAHELFVRGSPARDPRRHQSHKLVRQPDEFVRQHAAAGESRVAVVVIADGDGSARAQIVVGVEIE